MASLDLTGFGLKHLNAIDVGVIALYGIIVVGIGLYLRRRASRSLEDYFLAGKQLPWWALGVSGMLAFLDMTGTMVITSFLYMLGPRGLYVEFRGGAVLVLAFMMLWTGKWHYRSQVMTGAEWNIYRFGSDVGAKAARVITALAGMVFTFAMLAYLIKGAGTFLSTFLPYSPFTCALLMIILTVFYTLLSGFYGVVYTDLFQSLIVLIAVVMISVVAFVEISSSEIGLAEAALQVTGRSDWSTSVPSWRVEMPEGYKEFNWLALVAFSYFVRNIFGGMGTGADPRYFGARNERECGLLSFFWTWLMTFRWPMMMGFAVMGIFLVQKLFPDQKVLDQSSLLIKEHFVREVFPGEPEAIKVKEKVAKAIDKSQWEEKIVDIIQNQERYPELVSSLKRILGEKDWESKLSLVGYEGGVNPERILPATILMCIPAGLRGLLLISMVAAAMSTFAPTVNATTALFTKDIYQGFVRPKASNREMIGASWLFGIFLTVGGFVMAYSTKSINDIWDWIIMGLTAGLAIPQLLRLYWWRFNAGGLVLGTFLGILGAVIQRLLVPDMGPHSSLFFHTCVALTGAIAGTYLTKPTDPKVVEFFYKTTRPFGIWGPFKRLLHPETRRKMEREHFYDLVALPFALLWQITLFLLPMQAIIRDWRSFGVTLVLFLVSLYALIRLWYRQLPPADKKLPTIEEIDSGRI